MISMMVQDSIHILGVRIDAETIDQAQQKVQDFLRSSEQHTIFTPNPEMLVMAHKNKQFRDVLNRGSLNLCDGKGIELVARGKVKRIAGVDFIMDICKNAAEEGKSVYLLGSGSREVVERTRSNLTVMYPGLKIVGAQKGPKIGRLSTRGGSALGGKDWKIEENNSLVDDIRSKSPDILFVAFGHGKQELWIDTYLKELQSVKIAMGVGGAFDFISGKIPRAPQWMRAMGLEWLWRLFRQPWRAGRIWNATVKFLFFVFMEKFYKE